MVTAWQVPLNPLEDKTLDSSPLAEQIRWGYRIFVNTPKEAARFRTLCSLALRFRRLVVRMCWLIM